MIKPRYRVSSEVSANYDWTDFIQNIGYVRFYLTQATNSTPTVSYFLSTQAISSVATSDGGAGVSTIDHDYDITFLKPAYLGGADCFVNFTNYADDNATNTTQVTVYHVTAAGVETSLGTQTAPALVNGGGARVYGRKAVKIALTAHSFAIGEKLRITVYQTLGGAAATSGVFIDPLEDNAAAAGTHTDFSVYVPFRIDL